MLSYSHLPVLVLQRDLAALGLQGAGAKLVGGRVGSWAGVCQRGWACFAYLVVKLSWLLQIINDAPLRHHQRTPPHRHHHPHTTITSTTTHTSTLPPISTPYLQLQVLDLKTPLTQVESQNWVTRLVMSPVGQKGWKGVGKGERGCLRVQKRPHHHHTDTHLVEASFRLQRTG